MNQETRAALGMLQVAGALLRVFVCEHEWGPSQAAGFERCPKCGAGRGTDEQLREITR